MDRRWIGIIIISIATVGIWIGMEVLFSFLHRNEVEQDYTYYLQPVTPEFNEETIRIINEREEEFIELEPGSLE